MPLPFQPAPNTARYEVIFTQDGQRIENVFHVLFSSIFTTTHLFEAVAHFRDWWAGAGKGMASDAVSVATVVMSSLQDPTAPTLEFPTSDWPTGTRTSPAMPMNVTVAVSLRTALRGRSYRGRIYHVGLTEDMIANSVLLPTYVADVAASYSDLKSRLATGGFQLCVLSRVNGGVRRTTGVSTPVESILVDAFLDSQRRRLPGRGR